MVCRPGLFEELEALEHFFQRRCPDAPDLQTYRDRLDECQQLQGRPLAQAMEEAYWGPKLHDEFRHVAVQAFRLRNSQAFDALWRRETAGAAAAAADPKQGEDAVAEPLTVGQAVNKYRATRAAFDEMIRAVVRNSEVSFREISDLFGYGRSHRTRTRHECNAFPY